MGYNSDCHVEQKTRALCFSEAAPLSQLCIVGKVPSINGIRSVLAVPRDNGSAICEGHFAMDMNDRGVYALIFHTKDGEKIYIGSTVQPFRKRWNAHQSLLRRGIHVNSYLQNTWNKYGVPEFRILEVCYDLEKVAFCEQNWIDATDPAILINLGPAVPSSQFGKHISIEHRGKISKAQRGVKETPEVRFRMSQTHLGKKHSQETREKMSRTRMGHPGCIHSEDTRDKISRAHIGRNHSPETKEKMSLSRREYLINNPEVTKKLSISMKGNKFAVGNKNRLGKKLSAEKSEKLSLARKGRVISPAQRKKISEGLKAYNAKKKAEDSNAIG